MPFVVRDPVVAGATEHTLASHRAVDDDVVAGSAEVLDAIVAAEQEVVPVAADENVSAEPGPARNRIVARAALHDVVAVAAEQDVVAGAAGHGVVPLETVEAIVAVVAVERVVADVGDELIVARTTVEHDVLAAVQRIEEH